LDIEEQIRAYKEFGRQIDELEQKRKELSLAILQQMSKRTLSVAGYTVHRCSRLSFQVSIEEARELGATKMEEVLDKEMLKKLHQSGQSIPGVSSFQYIQILSSKKRG
jgi:hypothetical protein